MVNDNKKENPAINDQESEKLADETLLKELLKTAQKEDNLDGLSLQKRMEKILDLRIKLEIRMLKLIDDGLLHDDGTVSDKAVALHKAAKDSISELVKVHRLLCDLSTDNILISVEEQAELGRLRGMIFGNG